MKTLVEAQLCDGVIYGDNINAEYVYMPASEIGAKNPICVFEGETSREDVSMSEALNIIRRRSLKPVKHPKLGISSC